MSEGKPYFNYPDKLKAPEGEGCEVCGIILQNDSISGAFCSPECSEYEESCGNCGCGPSWCSCQSEENDC